MDILIPASEERAMSDDDLAHHISQELTKAHGTYESDQKHARFKGMRYYYGQLPRAPEKPRSGIRSTDIADVCDALIADILPMFSGKSSLAQFDAQNARDQYAAAEESKAVNYIFFEKCNGARFIRDMLQDGLLQRNATAQVEVVEDLKTETREYGPVTEQELALYMQNHVATRPNEALEVIGGTDYQDDGTVNQGDTSTVTLRRTWVERTLEVTAHAPENVFVCADHDSLDLSDARFVAFRVTPTRSDLVELGVPYDIAYNELPAYAQSRDYDKIARDRVSDTTAVRASHKSGEQVECYRCFYHIDVDGDGIAELHEVLYSRSKHILSDEIIDYSGLACFSPWPIAHKWVGTGIVDKLESIVEGKTVFLRQTIDNLIRVNNQRLVCVEGKEDPSSVENSDPLAHH